MTSHFCELLKQNYCCIFIILIQFLSGLNNCFWKHFCCWHDNKNSLWYRFNTNFSLTWFLSRLVGNYKVIFKQDILNGKQNDDHCYQSITLIFILLELKLVSCCLQYRARPVWPGSILLVNDQLQVPNLLSLK